jgi:glycosyltransferase involved in cell wall biosynthesis
MSATRNRNDWSVKMKTVSVIVPVYNAEETLGMLVGRTLAVLRELETDHEIILVNDGSVDGSWGIVEEIAANNPAVRGIDLMRNYGQHNALLCGIWQAQHEVVVTMDDDLQNPPEEIPKLVKALAHPSIDVVYGHPSRRQHGVGRNLASAITKIALQKSMGVDAARSVSAFRAFRLELREAFKDYDNSHVSIDVLLTWATTGFTAVEVRQDARAAGVSGYTFIKLITHAINMMTGFTTWPLRIASLVGFLFTAFGVVVLSWAVGRFLALGGSVPGFPFLASIIAIFAGAQLFSLGIIGEYLARMYARSQGRPPSVVRKTTERKTRR